jgi:hypothetical protein
MKSRKLESMQKLIAAIGAVGAWGVWYYGDRHGDAHPGVSGSAAGCGIITAACIICYVWIELHTTKTQEKQ